MGSIDEWFFGNVIDLSKVYMKKTTPDLSIVKRLGGSRGAKIQQVIGITSSRRILVFLAQIV